MQPSSEAAFFLLRQQQQQQQQQQSLFTTPNPLYIPLGSHKSASSGGTGHASGQLTTAICSTAIPTVPSAVSSQHTTGALKQQLQHQQQHQQQQQQITSMLNGHTVASSSAHDHQPMMLNGMNSRNSDRVPSPSSSVTTAPLSMHALNLHNRVMEMQYQQQSHHHLTPYNNQYIIPNHQHHHSTLNAATSATNGYHLYQNGNHLSHHPYLAGPTVDNCLGHAIYTSGSTHQQPQQQQQSQPVSSLYHGNVNGGTSSAFNGQVMHLPVMNGNNSVVDGTVPTAISSSATGSTGYRILNQSQQQQQQQSQAGQVNLQSRNITSRVQNHSSAGTFFHANANAASGALESSSSLFTHTNCSAPLLPHSNNTINGPAESTMNGSNGRSALVDAAAVSAAAGATVVNGHHQSLRESSNIEDTRGEPLLLASLDTSSTTSSMKFRQKKKKKPSPFKPPPAVFQMQLLAATGASFNPFLPASVDCTAVTSSTSTSAAPVVAGIKSSQANDLSNILSDILNNSSRSHQHQAHYSSTSSAGHPVACAVKSKSSLTHSPPPPPPPPPISERPRPPPPPQASMSRKSSSVSYSNNSSGSALPNSNGHHVYTNESATVDQHSSSSSGSYGNHKNKCAQVPASSTVNSDKGSGNNISSSESTSSPKHTKQLDSLTNGNRKVNRSHSPIDERPKCFYCAALIVDEECTEAEGGFYHIKCFACTSCHRTLGGLQYIMHSTGVTSNAGNSSSSSSASPKEPYCTECFDSLFGEYCEGCGQLIQVGTVEAITHEGRKWHAVDACFNCHNCNQSLLGLPFLPHSSGLIFCSDECSREAFTFAKVKSQYQSHKKLDKDDVLNEKSEQQEATQYNIQQVYCDDEVTVKKNERKNVKSSLCSSSSSSAPSTPSTPANNAVEKANGVHLPPPPPLSPASLHSLDSECDSHHQINHVQQVYCQQVKQVMPLPGDHRQQLKGSREQRQLPVKKQVKCASSEHNESVALVNGDSLCPQSESVNETHSLYSSINLLFKNSKRAARAKEKTSKCENESSVDESTKTGKVSGKTKSKSDTSGRKKVSHDVSEQEHEEEEKKVNCAQKSQTLQSENVHHWINDGAADDENGASVKCKQLKSSSKLSHNNYDPRKAACGPRNDGVKTRDVLCTGEEEGKEEGEEEYERHKKEERESNGHNVLLNGDDDINVNRNIQSEIITCVKTENDEKLSEDEVSTHTSHEIPLKRGKVAAKGTGVSPVHSSSLSPAGQETTLSTLTTLTTLKPSRAAAAIVHDADTLGERLALSCIGDSSNDTSISSASLSSVSHPNSSSPPLPAVAPLLPPKVTTALTANNHHHHQQQEQQQQEQEMQRKQCSPHSLLDRPRASVESDKKPHLTKETGNIIYSESDGGKVNAAFKKDEGSSSESNNNKHGEEEEEDVDECTEQRAPTKQEVKGELYMTRVTDETGYTF